EFRNGVLIGSTMRDIQVVILNCNNSLPQSTPPAPGSVTGGVLNGNRIEVCPGTPLSFQFIATDPEPTDVITVTDNTNISIPGSTITYVTNAPNSVTGTFSWIPSAADTGLNVFTVTVTDNACPTIGTNTFSYEKIGRAHV